MSGDCLLYTSRRITLTKCPESGKQIRPIIINAQGLGERINVSVEPICECDCEKEKRKSGAESSSRESQYCNSRGKVVCGVCECEAQYYGNRCECSTLDSADSTKGNNISACVNPRQDFGADGAKIVCNNQGRCNCGQCVCNDPARISGKYCECDNESCDRYLGQVCAGHGRCECGICKCDDGWTRSDCSCSTDSSPCVASNGLVCNGKGKCVCGKCVCDENSGYFGRRCEDCPTCPLPCENNRDCVQCKVFGTGKKKASKECDECDLELIQVKRVEMDSFNKKCQFIDQTDNCTFFFSYEISNDKRIRYQSKYGKFLQI